jgi:anti-sigma factor RsiW
MSFPEDATGTFEGRLGCPSELVMDRLAVGELSERSTAELRAHLDGCEVCRRRIDQRRPDRLPVPNLKRAAMLANIAARLTAPEQPVVRPAPPSLLRRHGWLLLVPLFAALGALAVWLLRQH